MYWRLVCMSVVLAACCLVDAAPSNNDTATTTKSTKPSNKGLGGLFSMTKGFIDLVMTKKSIIGALNEAAGDKKDFFNGGLSQSEQTKGYQEVAKKTIIGYAICIAIGIIFVLVMPWVGCCFGCCRCCGNCGGKPRRADPGPDRLKKTCFSIFFATITAFMLGAMICIFLNVSLIHDQTSKTSENSIVNMAKKKLDETEKYIKDVIKELKDVVIGGFNSTVNGVIETLDDTAKSAKEKLADVTNADVALNKTNDLVQKLKKVSQSLSNVNQITTDLKDETATLKNELDEVTTNLTTILNNCTVKVSACTNLLNKSESALKPDADFTQVDNISKELQTVKDVNLTKLEENIEEGRRAVENITQDISSITKSATEEVEKQINNGTRAEIVMQVDDSSKEITKLVNFSSARSKLTDQEDNVNDYGNYIYYAGLGLGCITLLIVLLYFLGLLFVICCSDEGSSCNQRTGTNFLMAGVGFTFIFVEFLMLLTMFLFIVGAPLYSVACRYTADLSDTARTEEFDKFLDALRVDLGHNLTISSVMAACGRNESLYNAAHLGDRIKIVEYLNISKYTALKDAIDELKNKNIDIGNVSILTNETKTMLDDLIGGSLESINFTSFTNQVDRNMTTGDLNNLIAQMQTTAGILKQDANDTAEKLQAQTNRLQEIQNSTVSALNKRKAELGEAIKELKVTLEENGGFTEDTNRLLDSLQNAEHNISAQGNSLLQNIVATLAEKMWKRISSELQDIGKKLTDNVGKCKKPLDIVQSTIDIGCISVLGPFNGLWFSLGWFIFFSIFGIIFAVKLVGVVRAVEVNGDNKSFEQVDPDAYYKGGGGGGRLDNNQWSAGRENHGYERTNSHSRDRHHRSSRNRREQQQRRQPRQPDYSSNRQPDYSSQRPPAYDSQQGYPQHYHNRGQW